MPHKLLSPAPWRWWDENTPGQPRPKNYDLMRLIAADGSRVLGCYGGAGYLALGKTPRDVQNAHLIEGAPGMLDALQSAEWMLARDFIDPQKAEVLEKVQDAIRAAGGKARYG